MSGALRERIRTALVLALITVGAVLWLPTTGLAVVLLPVMGLSAWELARLLGVPHRLWRWSYLLVLLALVLWGWFAGLGAQPLPLLLPVAALWLALVPVIFRMQRSAPATAVDWHLLLLSAPFVTAPWFGLLALHAAPAGGPWMVLFLLMLVWLTDSGAYFAGRRFGRRKLAPRLSPGKTIEGVMGGLLAAGLWSLALLPMAGDWLSWIGLALLCMLTAGISVVGDLVESWLKRRRNLKDSGALLPGHGGVLDRLDSLMAAVPVFAVGFLLWETLL
ncbi:hypothetical protein CKO36_09705 [Rhabdochromatium marinum]|nr:hypothetical protein [Rhabdochromatium marinum]